MDENKNLTLKIISLGVASAISALLFGFLFKSFINSGSLFLFILTMLAGLAFLAIFHIHSLLINNFWSSVAIIAIDAVLILGVFGASLSIAMLIAGLGVIGMLIAAYYGAQLELKNNLDIRFFKIADYTMRRASSALAIFAIVTYLSLLNLQDPAEARRALAIAIKPTEPITAAYVPGYTINDSLIEVSRKIMPPEVRVASPESQAEFIRQSSNRLAQAIGASTKTDVKTTDTTLDIAYKATIAKLLKLQPFVQTLILVGFGLVVFFLLKFLLIFVNWIAAILAFGIYQLLYSSNFFKVEVESRAKKVIIL
jgi:hypothetical protein